MTRASLPAAFDADRWHRARSGDLKGAIAAAREALAAKPASAASRFELHLVVAFCLIRQGSFSEALQELEMAAAAAATTQARSHLGPRVEIWRAEIAYFQGRYSAAAEMVEALLPVLEERGDFAYGALALRIRILVLLARADYEGIDGLAARALRLAETARDDYVLVQILNVLGAAHFDRATSRLPQPHARSHLTSLDPADVAPMEADARAALALFERARDVAERADLRFAAWYVAGNIERLEILLGHAERAIAAIRKRLEAMQAQGARYDEIVTRSNLAWGLRILGRHREALHELDVALDLARETGTFNVMLEFLHYDRSVVLGALGDIAGARGAYRRYLRSRASARAAPPSSGPAAAGTRRPLEPFFLKRADRFIVEHLAGDLPLEELAAHCGVSWRTLQGAFAKFRGITAVAHIRNVRLDHAHAALAEDAATVRDVAARCGFRSATTFALEYRKRFGMPPSRRKRAARARST
jgi:AraC-like DNA-binding protein/tetratricopeptide (TPR) repeat protein